MIWYSAVSVCFDELREKPSMETTSPGLCQGGHGSTGSGDHSGEMGMNGFRWSHGGQKGDYKKHGGTGLAEKAKKKNI